MQHVPRILAEKLAFVSGAGSGIGREACRVLAREGAAVIATDRDVKTVEETVAGLEGSGHIALEIDVTKQDTIEKAFKNVTTHFSEAPTIIVNSAGITRDNLFLNINEKDFSQVIDVNLKGTFLVMQNAVKAMIENNVTDGGSIINISSIVGNFGNIGQANYAASKAGVIALTKTAAMELGKLGIRVNVVLPGFIETPMTENIPENVKQLMIKKTALKRMGKPENVAEVIAFLASQSSSYVNGATLEVNGGFTWST